MPAAAAISIENVSHKYGDRAAIDELSLEIGQGEVFALLGPNGSGKTTLFRVLSTLIALQAGEVTVFGFDLRTQKTAIRRQQGVVFQSPSLDKKLTVAENLWHQGRMYGMAPAELSRRRDELLAAVGLVDRRDDRVETLSGGMRRRVELAKCMLHAPRLLVLDEPSTGLDPGARSDLWKLLSQLRDEQGTTILLTTHLLDEADRADRLGIMHEGRLVALGRADELRASVGGDAITIQTERPERLAPAIHERLGCEAGVVGSAVRIEVPNGHQWIARIVEAFPGEIQTITLGKPTLEDVFIDRTGHRFFGDDGAAPSPIKPGMASLVRR